MQWGNWRPNRFGDTGGGKGFGKGFGKSSGKHNSFGGAHGGAGNSSGFWQQPQQPAWVFSQMNELGAIAENMRLREEEAQAQQQEKTLMKQIREQATASVYKLLGLDSKKTDRHVRKSIG